MNQVQVQVPSFASMFSSAGELANLVVTSNLIDVALAKIIELLQRGQAALPFGPVVDDSTPNRTIVAFVPSPDSTQDLLPRGDLVESPPFNEFLRTQECSSVSINRAALTLFASIDGHHLDVLKSKLIEKEGQLIITGNSLGGSVASLFTLFLLDNMNKKSKCRPICITFGSPLLGNFCLQHSQWNSFFLHVVSNKDPVPGLFLSSTNNYKPFGTYLWCSELGCACFDDPDLILKLLTAISSEVARGGLQYVVDYGAILRNLKNMAICKGPRLVGERFQDPFSAGTLMELETIGFNQEKLREHDINIMRMKVEARYLAKKTKSSDAKKLNDIKKYMAQLEWYKKKSKDAGKGYYDCFKNGDLKRDIRIEEFMGFLTAYWEDMVAQAERKPQKEGASFRTSWLFAGTTYRRMVEPLDIAIFYNKKDGEKDYINNGRSRHYKLLQEWYDKGSKPPTKEELDSKKQKVSVLLTEDSCFWAHVEEAILSCESLKNPNSTHEQRNSSWGNLVKFGQYVMEQIENYAVSPEIFLEESSFMKWWGMYEECIDTFSNFQSSRLVDYMKRRSYEQYGNGY